MTKIRVSKEFHFEAAHALWNYDGLCKNIHGHSYKLIITVIGIPINDTNNPKNGMLIDFTDLKQIVNTIIIDKLDHAFLVNRQAEISNFYSTNEMFDRMLVVDYQPTCENILLDIVNKLKSSFPENSELFSVRLYETTTSYADWFKSDN
ncbi:MAG: 6-carboxytetrahydropterin synthase [Chlorobi bacterium]|nr:6-carboxytetrahydropterin synthase [Chlorobiota bacterium]